jgi:hypothetical protein
MVKKPSLGQVIYFTGRDNQMVKGVIAEKHELDRVFYTVMVDGKDIGLRLTASEMYRENRDEKNGKRISKNK